jgi:Flp pilus assembly protein protease CpaA
MFGYAISLLLIAIGAILAFAVTATVSGIAVHTVGWIVLIVGIVGFILSLILYSDWASRRRGRYPYDGPDA